ncbi:MAG: putative thiosulfate sulfurtransferase SseA [Thermoanaerobaculia bacterium]|nr:putative thiosulfate sulfurtransferase SseA [Thermoanaerobaculia bacterium]
MNSSSPPLVLDARSRGDFEAGHIQGARPVDWRDFAAVRPSAGTYFFGDPSRWGLLAEPGPKLVTRLRDLGLSRGRSVVVTGDPGGWGEEGRIAWMLLALGASDLALLDGGYPAWRDLPGISIERGSVNAIGPGDFDPVPQPGRRVRLEGLRSLLAEGRRPVLDARTEEEFEGKTLRGQKRGGHIPGARLVPALSLRDSSGRYVSAEALSRLTGPVVPDAPPITYCTGGVRSALLAVLIEARLGIVVANYDGSLWEWSAHPELPLATGPTR